MYNGIGLQTPRGSGTNGHVQTNKFFIRPKTSKVSIDGNKGFGPDQGTAEITKKPNKQILEHDRKRQIELKLVILEDKLAEQGYTDAEIADRIAEARRDLEAADLASVAQGGGFFVVSENKSSDTQTHQIAARKEKQMETLRAALGIKSPAVEDAEYEEGEILRGHENKGSKIERQMRGDVETEHVDRSGDHQHLESEKQAGGGGTRELNDEVNRKDAKKTRLGQESYNASMKRKQDDGNSESDPSSDTRKNKSFTKNTLKKRYDVDLESDSSLGVTRKASSVRMTQKHSATSTKKRHDSDSESDSSIDRRRRRYSTAEKAKKTSATGTKKRHNSDSDSDGSVDPKKQMYSSTRGSRKTSHVDAKKRDDSDSASDSSIDTRRRYSPTMKAKKKAATGSKKQHDSDSDSDVGVVLKKQRYSRTKDTRKASNTDAKKRDNSDSASDSSIDTGGRYNPVMKAKEEDAISTKKRHDSDSDSDVNVRPKKQRYSHSKDIRKTSNADAKKRVESDLSIDTRGRYNPTMKAKEEAAIGTKKWHNSDSDSDASLNPKKQRYNPAMKAKEEAAIRTKKRHNGDSDGDASLDPKKQRYSHAKDIRRTSNTDLKKRGDSDSASDSESDSSIDTRGRYNPGKKANMTSGAHTKKRHDSDSDIDPSVDPKLSYGQFKLMNETFDIGAKKSHGGRFESNDDWRDNKVYHGSDDPKEERIEKGHGNYNGRKSKDEGMKEGMNKDRADDFSRRKYSNDDFRRDDKVEKERYSKSYGRVEETSLLENKKRGRKEEIEDGSRRDKRDKDTSKRGRYQDVVRRDDKVEEECDLKSYGKVNETSLVESRRRGRKEELDDGSRGDEGDSDTSKRGRYDDYSSRDRRRYESERHEVRRRR